ncbi:MAG TPA: PQQ-binding-like beta-propeller repeat protein [Patescibacteria group bacterium]|nr:PQQ-binding-like beta-propeller repeat protein [Patescibacteria group bacterium]
MKKPLRLWPGLLAAVLLLLVRFVVPAIVPDAFFIGFFGSHLCALAILVWWLFFSRAPWSERLGAILLMVIALLVTSRLVHESIAKGVVLLYLWAIPTQAVALVAWAAASRRLSSGPRYALLAATVLLSTGFFALVRIAGVTGNMASELHWRWTPTPEQRLLAQARDTPAGSAAAPSVAETKAGWPGFRGPGRDGIVRGVRIGTDWSKSPPVELWRRPVGPGWSSFAVGSGLLYTQEQLGEDEVVSCYDLTTGKPVWMHRDPTRFYETAGGAGPRATPTLSNGRVYTFGATGIFNALAAGDGALVWSRNVVADAGAKVPDWGFSSSPLVVGDIVIVAAASQLVAYDLASGEPRWKGAVRGGSFSSPHFLTIDAVAQVLLMGRDGATSVAPADGTKLWDHAWAGVAMLQPAVITGGDLLISTTGTGRSIGLRRVAVTHGPGGWTSQERWTTTAMKPYFNDFVVHKGHAYGFDGSILSCLDVEDGRRLWKGGRYGNGQLLLLADQDLLLVVSEQGELALVSATPDKFTELARLPAIEGKTWNHPAMVGDILLIRNDQEMTAFRLPLAGD